MGILLWASAVIGRYAGVDGVLEGQELVDRGPYRRVRHPIYGCFITITFGLALMFRSYLLVAALASWLAASWWAAKAEEVLLSATLGERYDAYRRRTGRFLPKVQG